MTALPTKRPHCQHPGACRAKGAGHCRSCAGMKGLRAAAKRGAASRKESVRAKKVQITLAPLGAAK